MRSTVWKFDITIDRVLNKHTGALFMPSGAAILFFGSQDSGLKVWAQVEEEAKYANVDYCILGTGGELELSQQWCYRDSCQENYHGVDFVWHLFTAVQPF